MADAATLTFPIETLRDFSARTFLHFGLPEEDALIAADVLAASDLRGIESHGIARLWTYARLFKETDINPRPEISIVRETASTATVDGDGGLGLVVGPKANRIAIEKAAEVGTGWVAVRRSSHYGIAGYYPLMALEHDMIGWSMTNCAPHVAPLWGKEARLGTNPIAIAFPAGNRPPVVIDMSTSVASGGKVEIASRNGDALPSGWLIDEAGQPTNDPDQLLRHDGVLLPLGADYEHGGHKGYCLASMVDLLSGVLSGACWGPFVPSFSVSAPIEAQTGDGTGHFFGAMRVDAFSDVAVFKARVDAWILSMRDTEPAPGNPQPIVPGELEHQAELERTASGIPLTMPVIESLRTLSDETGVPFD